MASHRKETTVSRPRPVLTSASILGLVQALILILTFLGYNQSADVLNTYSSVLVSVALGAVTVGGSILHGLHSQAKVTPLVSPVAVDGTPLVPVTAVAASVESAPVPVVSASAAQILASAASIHP
jgi:hypothetical protein